MKLKDGGLLKLTEECGELVQVAAKTSQYIHEPENHPDGNGDLRLRLQEEISDVLAAILYVTEFFKLDSTVIEKRREKKIQRFRKWDSE